MAFRPERTKWEQNPWFTPLSETTNIIDHNIVVPLSLSRLPGSFGTHFSNLEHNFFEFRALFYISSTLEHLIDFWAEFEHFFRFLGIFFTVFHMLNAIFCLWNVFSKAEKFYYHELWIILPCRLTGWLLSCKCTSYGFLTMETADFDWFVTSCLVKSLIKLGICINIC